MTPPSKTPRRLEYRALNTITSASKNPKNHDLVELTASMVRFGFLKPLIHDGRTNRLIAGHGRTETLAAAESAGLEPPEGIQVRRGRWFVPVVIGWASRNDAEASAALLAVNRLVERGGWNMPDLTSMLTELSTSSLGLTGVGWAGPDLDAMLRSLQPAEPITVTEHQRDPNTIKPRTKAGDVWLLGPHRVLCGDCRNPADVDRVLAGATVNLGVTSPPYAEQRDYDPASGFRPIPPDEYVEWFAPVAANVKAHLAVDGSWFVNIKPSSDGLDTDLYVFDLVTAHVRAWGWHFATEFCWERNGVPKSVSARFKNQFEPVYQFALGRWKIRPNNVAHPSADAITAFGPGRGNTWADPDSAVVSQGQKGDMFAGQRAPRKGRGNTSWKERQGNTGGVFPDYDEVANGMAYPGNRLPTFSGSHTAVGHNAAYPVGLPAWFALAYTDIGDTVFDPFCGSGSTIIAAHQHDRVGYGIELSPTYCDMICARWHDLTGITPILERTGRKVSFRT